MSGLEAVAAVAAIVSGFASGVSLYRSWRSKAKNSTGNGEVECSLDESGPLVKREYEKNYELIGRRFAVGDGTWYTCSVYYRKDETDEK